MKPLALLTFLLITTLTFGQARDELLRSVALRVQSDTTRIDSVSLNPSYLLVRNGAGEALDPSSYTVDFAEALFIRLASFPRGAQVITVEYKRLPDFLTRTYTALDPGLQVERSTPDLPLYSVSSRSPRSTEKPFEGLFTSGSLSRGLSFGNNQDAVVQSNFNLQVEGQLSNKVGIRASITDNEVPLQAGGFTQRLEEFDKVFIELFSQRWGLMAGDLDLVNNSSYFMRFQKKVAGVSVRANLGQEQARTDIFASGAIVRGKFQSYKFTAEDGNQGPYRIFGAQNQQFVILISGSERVYVNGVQLQRGENHDYVVDYNTAELTFTSLYPVNSNMRVTVEYQLAERSYNRFLTYDGLSYQGRGWKAGVRYFNESDLKSSPLDQDLSEEQRSILSAAGNDRSKMIAPSAVPATYDENRILYRKEIKNGREVFVFSNDPDDALFQVTFSYVGQGQGDYVLETTLAAGRVYAFLEQVDNQPQGDYMPLVRLQAPERLQLLAVEGRYEPHQKTDIRAELQLSDWDQNLFSSIDDQDNDGVGVKVNAEQALIDKNWKLSGDLDYEYLSEHFRSVERIRNVEFNRDWNIGELLSTGTQQQQLLQGGLRLEKDSIARLRYTFERLDLGSAYGGHRHGLIGDLRSEKTNMSLSASLLQNEQFGQEADFYRFYGKAHHRMKKTYIGSKFNYEKNELRSKVDGRMDPLSHGFSEFEAYAGRGDSTAVFVELGYNFRVNDSLRSNRLQEVDRANAYFLKSRLFKTSVSDLSLYLNYRRVEGENRAMDKALNGRLSYRQRLFNNIVRLQTVLESSSGSIPLQDFVYVEVEPGKGFYEWIDFNGNGLQELDEFVVAKFPDQALYVRVLLPGVRFQRTENNKWSQSVLLNFTDWRNQGGFKALLSHFSSQTYFLIDSRRARDGEKISWNPFEQTGLLGLNRNFKNSVFFNRGLQRYSLAYTILDTRNKAIFSFGDQDNELSRHQFQFIHKLGPMWLGQLESGLGKNQSRSDTYPNRNYRLELADVQAKLSYLQNKNTRFDLSYSRKDKKNTQGGLETLKVHRAAAAFQFANSQKFSVTANVNYIHNAFEGSTNSPVAYQMLEGLQPGNNLTWLAGMQKRLTSFLDLNLSYTGRKSEEGRAIHTGNMQLRATF